MSVGQAAVARTVVRRRVWRRDVLAYIVGHDEVAGKATSQIFIALQLNMSPNLCSFTEKLKKEKRRRQLLSFCLASVHVVCLIRLNKNTKFIKVLPKLKIGLRLKLITRDLFISFERKRKRG